MNLVPNCVPTDNHTCLRHGSDWIDRANADDGLCSTEDVLCSVAEERQRQYQQYGTNSDLEDGTGPSRMWALPVSAKGAGELQDLFRMQYEMHEEINGKPTWMHLVREEIAEAFQEKDPERLEEELVQVAALCVSWVEKIRARDDQH